MFKFYWLNYITLINLDILCYQIKLLPLLVENHKFKKTKTFFSYPLEILNYLVFYEAFCHKSIRSIFNRRKGSWKIIR